MFRKRNVHTVYKLNWSVYLEQNSSRGELENKNQNMVYDVLIMKGFESRLISLDVIFLSMILT